MIGWAARLGVILPSLNATTESEMYRMAPSGVSIHTARMEFVRTDAENFEGMLDDVPRGVRHLSHARVHAIAFACTSGSLYGGPGYDAKIASDMRDLYDVPTTTTSTAVVAALRELQVRRVAVATPYQEWIDELEKAFLEANGFEVVNIRGMGLTGFDVCEVHPETVYGFARAADRAEADAIFLSCMGLRTLEVLPALERDLGKPALSSNLVTMWMLLRLAGVHGAAAPEVALMRTL